ncbi:MAG: hypothetical protein AAF810_05460 [Cyanobacteria bacterium P01_D01_bin.36]
MKQEQNQTALGCKAKARLNSFSVKNAGGSSYLKEEHGETQGTVATEYGIVDVYSLIDFTRLYMILEGRMYSWNCSSRFSKRYLVTLAKRFASHCHALSKKSSNG